MFINQYLGSHGQLDGIDGLLLHLLRWSLHSTVRRHRHQSHLTLIRYGIREKKKKNHSSKCVTHVTRCYFIVALSFSAESLFLFSKISFKVVAEQKSRQNCPSISSCAQQSPHLQAQTDTRQTRDHCDSYFYYRFIIARINNESAFAKVQLRTQTHCRPSFAPLYAAAAAGAQYTQ